MDQETDSVTISGGGGVADLSGGDVPAGINDLSQPVIAAAAGFNVWESHLPAVLGVGLRKIRENRARLVEGRDWVADEGDFKRVKYSAVGVAELKRGLGLGSGGSGEAQDAPEKPGVSESVRAEKPAQAGGEVAARWVNARVSRLFRNTRLVEVEGEGLGRVTARVNPGWGVRVGWPMEVRRDGENVIWVGRPHKRWPRAR